MKPDLQADDPRPHLFAQGVGGVVLAVSTVALLTGISVPGWALAGVVVVLAAVNLFFGFCVGCFLYFQLVRRGIHLSLPGWQNS